MSAPVVFVMKCLSRGGGKSLFGVIVKNDGERDTVSQSATPAAASVPGADSRRETR